VSISPTITLQFGTLPDLPVVVILVAFLGLANALCWPAIWPMALEGLGGYTKIAGALLIMAIIGGAIVPLIYGSWAESINTANELEGIAKTAKSGNQMAYILLIPCYLMIIFYAFKGHKYRSWTHSNPS
jgi:fucose permease